MSLFCSTLYSTQMAYMACCTCTMSITCDATNYIIGGVISLVGRVQRHCDTTAVIHRNLPRHVPGRKKRTHTTIWHKTIVPTTDEKEAASDCTDLFLHAVDGGEDTHQHHLYHHHNGVSNKRLEHGVVEWHRSHCCMIGLYCPHWFLHLWLTRLS